MQVSRLKEIGPSRKAAREIEETPKMNYKLDTEERDILDRFERDELRTAPGAEREMENARKAARNTLNRTKRVDRRA